MSWELLHRGLISEKASGVEGSYEANTLHFPVHYTDRPLRAFGKLGFRLMIGGAGILSFLVVYSYTYNITAVREHSGWFLISIMLIISSLQITLSGILAEILICIQFGSGDRRIYHIRREWAASRLEH